MYYRIPTLEYTAGWEGSMCCYITMSVISTWSLSCLQDYYGWKLSRHRTLHSYNTHFACSHSGQDANNDNESILWSGPSAGNKSPTMTFLKLLDAWELGPGIPGILPAGRCCSAAAGAAPSAGSSAGAPPWPGGADLTTPGRRRRGRWGRPPRRALCCSLALPVPSRFPASTVPPQLAGCRLQETRCQTRSAQSTCLI